MSRSSELVADARSKTAPLFQLAKDGALIDDLLAAAYLDGYNAALRDREAIVGEHIVRSSRKP